MAIPTTQTLFKNKFFWFSLLLAMADSAAFIVSSIYAYSIVLSNYPAKALIYYMVLQTIFVASIRVIGLRFFSKNPKKVALIQYGLFVTLGLCSILLLNSKAYVIPFIVAIVISGVTALATIICWSMLSLAFSIREYKVVAKCCSQASYGSSIISSFGVPLLVTFFTNNALLVFITLMLGLCGVLIFQLPILYKEEKVQRHNKKIKKIPIKYPLYHYMMFFTILSTTILGISQYVMRLESASYFTHEQLSAFFGYFSGVTNCLGLLAASTCERVLKRSGLQGLLFSIPVISLLSSCVVIFFPGFWSIIALGATRNVFGYSYGTYGTEITLNILPSSIRFITKANIKATANIVSTGLLVTFTIGKTTTYYLTWWIPPLCFLALWFAYKVKQYYKITLQQESAFKRFSILEEITPGTKPILKDIALNAIKEKDTYSIFYGLDLINKLYVDEAPPPAIYTLLEDTDAVVRYEMINRIRSNNMSSALPFLIARLPNEPEPEIQYKLIESIAHFDLNAALSACENSPHALFTPIIKNLHLIYNSNNPKEPLQRLIEFSQHSNPVLRKMVASLIGVCQIHSLSKCLKDLIADKDNGVSDEALRSAALMGDSSLIPDIITSLLNNKKNITPQLALRAIGQPALPYLSKITHIRHSKLIIKLIAAIPGQDAEEALIKIAQQGTMYHRSLVAKYANNRACKIPSSEEFKRKAYYLMEEELSRVLYLHEQMKSSQIEKIQIEIKSRLILAKILFIQWLALATLPKEVNQLIPSLIHTENEQVFNKALELLELYLHDKKISSYLSFLFEEATLNLDHPLPPLYPDPWLEQIMTNLESQSSLLSIVFELRSIRLFHHLHAEVLLALAEEVSYLNFNANDVIFDKNDLSDGLYCITQGEVAIIRDEKIVNTLRQHDFFGELALLDDEPRIASAVAQSPCTLLFIEKNVFNRIADDVPDILRTVIKVILEYLRKNFENHT